MSEQLPLVVDDWQLWLSHLPLDKPLASAQSIYEQLGLQLNALRANESHLAILQACSHVSYLLQKKAFTDLVLQQLISVRDEQTLMVAFNHLHSRLVRCFMHVLLDNAAIEESPPWLVEACVGAIDSLLATTWLSHLLYADPQKTILLKLYQLYQYAEKKQWLNIKSKSSNKNRTISDLFSLGLLMSCAPTERIDRSDLILLPELLEHCSPLLIIRKERDDASVFAFDLDKDIPPKHIQYAKDISDSNNICYLDTSNICGMLTLLTDQHVDTDYLPSRLSVSAVKALLSNLAGPSVRRSPRTSRDGLLDVCVGLDEIYYYFNNRKSFQAHQYLAKQILRENHGIPTPLELDAMVHLESQIKSGSFRRDEFQLSKFSLEDASPEGFQLIAEPEESSEVQAGELVGIHFPQQTYMQHWHLGQIRWFHKEASGTIHIGVLMLSPSADAVVIQNKVGMSYTYFRGLLLPELINTQQPSSIILPANLFSSEQVLELIQQDHMMKIILKERIQSNRFFSHFIYEMQDAKELTTPKSIMLDIEQDEIWRKLSV